MGGERETTSFPATTAPAHQNTHPAARLQTLPPHPRTRDDVVPDLDGAPAHDGVDDGAASLDGARVDDDGLARHVARRAEVLQQQQGQQGR